MQMPQIYPSVEAMAGEGGATGKQKVMAGGGVWEGAEGMDAKLVIVCKGLESRGVF